MADEVMLNDMEKDALKETANIGAGNASASLSKEVSKKVNLTISDLNIISMDNLEGAISGPQRTVVGIYTPIMQEMQGSIVIMFNKDSALSLAMLLEGAKSRSDDTLSENDNKFLKKVGNIISESYLGSLNSFLSTNMKLEDTNVLSTFGESIVDIIMLRIDQDAENALLIKTDFSVESTDIKGEFILILAVKSLQTLLDKIKSNLG